MGNTTGNGKRLLLTPGAWEECHIRVVRIYQGMPLLDGRNMECSPEHLTAWLLHAGSVVVGTARASFRAVAGDWLFLPNGYRKQRFSRDADLTSLMFRLCWQDGRPLIDLRPGLLVRGEEASGMDKTLPALARLLAPLPDRAWFRRGGGCDFEVFLTTKNWFSGWLAEAFRVWRARMPDLEAAHPADPRVDAARRWIEARSMEEEVDMREAAKVAGVSFVHLNRLFMRHHHQTAHEFLRYLRIRYARRRLLDPAIQIKAVAHEMGFRDLSTFSIWFRRAEQISPREYRRRLGWGSPRGGEAA
ncbi:AraC family transcriptional regulator [Opitutaceae bacterium TAV5]|nr:AraC family transcriptional regulator [Opitutaceae bacterium TAV5]